ncbi:MAG: formyltransferase family protein [Achromobacter veterisilvae]
MNIMIVGQKWLGAALLRQCLADGHQVLAVSAPPAEGAEYDRLYAAARQAGIPAVCHRGRLPAEAVPMGVDIILAAHAHVFIEAQTRCRARLGALGYHPSLLPRHRGRDAVRWAIHMREAVTGGSLYWMDDGADTGPIAAQDWCHIRPDDTAATLWRRELAPMGLRLFRRVLRLLVDGGAPTAAQDSTLATWEPAFARPRLGG